jgi:hypothetical protein
MSHFIDGFVDELVKLAQPKRIEAKADILRKLSPGLGRKRALQFSAMQSGLGEHASKAMASHITKRKRGGGLVMGQAAPKPTGIFKAERSPRFAPEKGQKGPEKAHMPTKYPGLKRIWRSHYGRVGGWK